MKNGIDSDESRICDAVNGGMGCSEANSNRVSAPTMPPIEWPISITWTEGSMVGEGVELETSMSITLFCSLPSHLISTIAREVGRGGEEVPFAKPPDAIFQIAPRLEFGVRHVLHGYVWERMSDERGKLVWEFEECIVAAL